MTTTEERPDVKAIPMGLVFNEAHPFTEEERADLARWVVSLRRAHRAGTGQTTGQLADRDGYCCLGIWCTIAQARGQLESVADSETGTVRWRDVATATDPNILWDSGSLPHDAYLARSCDPELIQLVRRDIADEEGEEWLTSGSASDVNDSHGLTFDEIADLVVWSYGLTPEELAAAELEPRVPVVEGPAN